MLPHQSVGVGSRAAENEDPESIRSKALAALGVTLHVPEAVIGESLYVRRPDPDESKGLVKAPIDVEALIAAGVLQRCDVDGENESALLLGYAIELDDGEAACLAVAKSRGWDLATDDRVASRVAGSEGVAVLNTAELMMRWAENTRASKPAVKDALMNITRYASFRPRADSRGADWWRTAVS